MVFVLDNEFNKLMKKPAPIKPFELNVKPKKEVIYSSLQDFFETPNF